MELLDYLRLRWRLFALFSLLGVAVIVLYVSQSNRTVYEASSEMLISPPAALGGTYASSPERYTNTQMAELYLPGFLDKVSSEAGMSAGELAGSLTYSTDSNSDVVTLTVEAVDGARAVRAVNATAAGFVGRLKSSNVDPLRAQLSALDKSGAEAITELQRAAARIREALASYGVANPGRGLPNPNVLAPRAAAEQTILNNRLQQDGQQRAKLQASIDAGSPARVIRRASGASPSSTRGIVEYLSSMAGLVGLLLVILGVGLTMSRRILGEARWMRVTRGSQLRSAISLRHGSARQSEQGVRRVVLALRTLSRGGPVVITFLPGQTDRLDARARPLIEALEAEVGNSFRTVDSLADVVDTGTLQGVGDAAVLMLVDVAHCEIEDVNVVSQFDSAVTARVLPVLI